MALKQTTKHGLLSEQKNKKELYKNILRVKKFSDDYTNDEVDAIQNIIYNPFNKSSIDLINIEKNVILFGSSIYKGNIRAGDIDIIQISPIDKQSIILQWIVNKLILNNYNNSLYFIGDIKCGIVSKFKSLKKYIGTYQNGKIIDYNYEACKYSFNLSSDFKDANLILPQKIITKNDFINYLKCNNLAHELITRRWLPDQIIDGYIIEEDNSEYTLKQACYDSELTKIDMYNFLNSNFKEITNSLFDLKQFDDTKVFEDQLTFNMLIQYYAKDELLKSLKRLYALSRIKKNEQLTLLLHDFTQRSITGAYNTIINELKVLIDILERHGLTFLNDNSEESKTRVRRLRQHLGNIEIMIQKLYNPYYEEYRKLLDHIDDIDTEMSYNRFTSDNIKMMINLMNGIIQFFNEKINILCKEFIKENNINFEQYLKY
jgi:hypothetical protein